VRREDLDDTSSVASCASSAGGGDNEERAEVQRILQEKLRHVLQWDDEPVAQGGASHDDPNPETARRQGAKERDDDVQGGGQAEEVEEEVEEKDGTEEFEFRLFSSVKPGFKIVLEDDRPFKPGGGGIVAKRPASYYLRPPMTAEARRRFESVSVTGDEIISRSHRPCWGLALPWKVVATLQVTSNPATPPSSGAAALVAQEVGEKAKRTRPGKKTRIQRRQKDRAATAMKEREEEAKTTKEEHLKAKKKRLNHAKKMRARAKAKEKKQQLGVQESVQGGSVAGRPEGSI
jgi:hypothetical protein